MNEINNALRRSILKIKQLNKKPSVKEWNKIAAEENLLSAISLRVKTGIYFNQLYTEIKK